MQDNQHTISITEDEIKEANDLLESFFQEDTFDDLPRFTSLEDLEKSLKDINEDDDDDEEDQNNVPLASVEKTNIKTEAEEEAESLAEISKDYEENVKFVDDNLVVERPNVSFSLSREQLQQWNQDMGGAYHKLFVEKKFD